MRLLRRFDNLSMLEGGSAATIGNFDGVHLGHQAIIRQVREQAKALELPSVVISFEPQPREFFDPDNTPARLTRFREKYRALEKLQIDYFLCIRFDQAFASLSAEEFIRRVLVEGIHTRYLVVGDDFRFGQNRAGDFAMLQQAGKENRFSVASTPTVAIGGERVSSTRIRNALLDGDMQQAARCLGRPYVVSGRVRHGFQRGRTIGFPTANVALDRHVTPVTGVFAVKVNGLGEQSLPGVANIGTRPTVDGNNLLLEVFLFDFDQEIYGRYIDVELVQKIRAEKKFDSFDELKQQIDRDVAQAQSIFNE